ncbi:alpha-2-macroglobulin family protein [Roseomonas sp. SSH11]|uniref:Alpha-2-macroglobulin family protein n=1 Tax=Pararoseomonas baculiformis TaxID=2820812 RepID=A0ABS4AHV7_9PROT|nr:MG2 domain-containing protein [Pararoseomonas baculiformis]MBP0446110.1 alpha-2-macroglobulin family protein [Pararoseomonas baculiformis]
MRLLRLAVLSASLLGASLVGAPLLGAGPALAQGFELPGLSADSGRYASGLARRFPAGGTPAQRSQAEQRAQQAEARGDWPAAIAAWEERLGMGNARPEMWLALGRAAMARSPADPGKALMAAQQNFNLVPAGVEEVPSLRLMADALRAQNRWPQAIQALEAMAERMPADPAIRQALADARREAGMLLRRVQTEPEAEPARACLSFTVAPQRDGGWQPEDWVRADPPLPGMAVTRESDQLCVAGLPWGRRTRLVLRAGLPGEGGANLRADLPVDVSMPDRAATIAFDQRAFILPRGAPPRVSVGTMNIETLSLRLVRVSERNLVPLTRDTRLGEELNGYQAEDIPESRGRVVWEGKAEIPRFQRNAMQRTVLPLPAELTGSGPGLFVLLARDAQEGENRNRNTAALPIMATDLGLTAWRGSEGVAVQARGLGDARPKPGVRVSLMARNNDVLAEAVTGEDGLARFGGPLLRGEGPVAPVALHAQLGEDLVALDLEAASFDLSDRGVTGRAYPGPVDAFLWLDRGIYRPGEQVRLSLLPRDAAGRVLELPVRLRLKRPNGQVAQEAVPERGPEGVVLWSPQISAGAPVGAWTIEALTDPNRPPVATIAFQVEAFVPERLEVKLGPAPGPLTGSAPLSVPVETRFLYGAPGAGLSGSAEMRLAVDPEPFEQWRGWRFGLAEEPFDGGLREFEIGGTDEAGKGVLELSLPSLPDTSRPLRAELVATMAEPGGRGSKATLTIPVRSAEPFIALRPAFRDGSVDEGAEAAIEAALVSPSGEALAGRLRARLVRERPTWRMAVIGGRARYQTVWQDEPVDAADLTVAPGSPARFARRVAFGRYRLEVTQPGGLAIASIRFRAGWTGSDDPVVPDKVDVAADRRAYAPGQAARLRITPPFAGRASLAVLTDRVVSVRDIEVPEGGTEVEVPVDAAWGPGAWVAVTVFRPGEAQSPGGAAPRRAIGLAWVGLDPAARRLEVALEGEALLRPRQRVEVPVRVANASGPSWLTLAAVDEGILRLTRFTSPDPAGHFLGRRKLGLDIRDDYGRLIAPADGEPTTLRQGGDSDLDTAGVQPPQRIVALFSGVVAVGPDGRAVVPLELPEFNGELRLMAVAWSGDRVGSATRSVTVRDPVVAEALLPRFMAPGDEARMPVLLHNLDLPAGAVAASVSVEGPLAVEGGNALGGTLAQGQRSLPAATLRATGAGEGIVRLSVSGPGGYAATHESRMTLRSPRPLAREVVTASLAPNAAAQVAPDLARFYAGTATVRGTWGQPVRYDPAALMQVNLDFPFACGEQAASRLLALIGFEGEAERELKMQRSVAQILDKQRFDGSLALWSAGGPQDRFVTVYGAEALLRARAAGVTVPDAPLEALLSTIREEADTSYYDEPFDKAVQAYRLHVLAMAGRALPGAARRLFEILDQLPTPLAKAQLGAAFARMGDGARAEEAFAAALAAPGRRPWYQDYGNATRDSLAVALLLKESGVLPGRLAEALGRVPGAELTPETASTQEATWAVLLASSLGRDGRPVRIALAGRNLPQAPVVSAVLDGRAEVRNLGDRAVPQAVSVTGLPVQPPAAARQGMRITRRFFNRDGTPLNLDTIAQNQVFLLQVEARAETGETHRTMIQQGLPAGWEIVGRFPQGQVDGMPFLGELSEAEAFPALDDRFAAAVTLTPEQPLARFAVRIRAVTAGRFELPGAEVRDMYRPGIFARQNPGRVAVAPLP